MYRTTSRIWTGLCDKITSGLSKVGLTNKKLESSCEEAEKVLEQLCIHATMELHTRKNVLHGMLCSLCVYVRAQSVMIL